MLDLNDIFGFDDEICSATNDEEMEYKLAVIELMEIPLKHIERYLREKKLKNLEKL